MSGETTASPAAIIQSAENKAGVIESTFYTMHSQFEGLLPLREDQSESAYETGLLGTLDHCLALADRLQSRLVDLTEKVGLVRP